MCSKYLDNLSIVEWFRQPVKSSKGSIVWKPWWKLFPLVGKRTIWKIWSGRSVRVGEHPWLGARNNFSLSAPLVQNLQELNILLLRDVCIVTPQPRGRAGWRDVAYLPLPADLSVEWDTFIPLLCKNFISPDEESEDSMCWSKNPKDRSFTAKLGYKAWLKHSLVTPLKWWWKPLWKLKAPLRCKITLWLALNNKLLTWDNGLKRGWCRPNHCAIWMLNLSFIFLSLAFSQGRCRE